MVRSALRLKKHANGCSVQGARAVEASQFFAQELKFIFILFFALGQSVEKKERKKSSI